VCVCVCVCLSVCLSAVSGSPADFLPAPAYPTGIKALPCALSGVGLRRSAHGGWGWAGVARVIATPRGRGRSGAGRPRAPGGPARRPTPRRPVPGARCRLRARQSAAPAIGRADPAPRPALSAPRTAVSQELLRPGTSPGGGPEGPQRSRSQPLRGRCRREARAPAVGDMMRGGSASGLAPSLSLSLSVFTYKTKA
jgi:hypothetical protein